MANDARKSVAAGTIPKKITITIDLSTGFVRWPLLVEGLDGGARRVPYVRVEPASPDVHDVHPGQRP